MKIKFENKKWFEFLRDKIPDDVYLSEYSSSAIDARSPELELIVGSNQSELKKWIESKVPLELVPVHGTWNCFIYEKDNFKKTIRFCHNSNYVLDNKERLHKPGRFLDNFILDTDPPINFKEKKEENKMANNLGIWEMSKTDFKDGLWRNGANEMVEVVKAGILKACKLQKMNKLMYEGIKKTLNYKVTTGAIHAALGYALTYVPMLSTHPHAARMAKELRVEGFKFVQSEVIGAIKDLVPDLLKILSSVSPEEDEQVIKIEQKLQTKRIGVFEPNNSISDIEEVMAEKEAMAEKETTVQAKRTATATN